MRSKSRQKNQTHQRIVTEAAELFRENGYSASGVDAVMKAAGLTAGGFYSHFKNKDALLIEAIRQCRIKLVDQHRESVQESENARQFAERYLSTQHRDAPGEGCPLPALAGEISRQSKKVRAAFTSAFLNQLDGLAKIMPGKTATARADTALETLASAAGAMLLARAVDDEVLSRRILSITQAAITEKNREQETKTPAHSRARSSRRNTRRPV